MKNGHEGPQELSPQPPPQHQPADEFAVGQALQMIGNDMGTLARRIGALEQAYGQMQQVHREAMERQSRYSALDLAIKAQPPGSVDGAVTTMLAETFLAWLQAMPQGQALRLLLTTARILRNRMPEFAPSYQAEDIAALNEVLMPYDARPGPPANEEKA